MSATVDGENAGTALECYVAGVLSTFPPYDTEHPAECLPMAKAVLDATSDWQPDE